MSNRTLIEFNHDFSHSIAKDPAGFAADLGAYLSSASPRTAEILERRYGMRVFGMRHHSDGFDIKWGGNAPVSETDSR